MAIELLSFDLDDTLWPCLPTILRAEKLLYEWMCVHVPQIAAQHTVASLREQRIAYMREHPGQAHDLTASRLQSMRALSALHEHHDEWVEPAFEIFLEARQQVELFDEVAGVLDLLAARYRMVALSNGNADIDRTGIARWMEFCLNAEQAGVAKPHPEIFRSLLDLSGLAAEQVVHIGDDPVHDVQGAYQAGIASIWVNRARRRWPHRDFYADREIGDLGELPAALAALDGHAGGSADADS